MRKLAVSLFLLALLSGPASALAKDEIILTLPESVIANAAKAILPLKVDANSNSIQGDITIINISNLELTNGHLACNLQLAGNNLAFVTEIAGHEIKLKVGAVEIEFATHAEIRFDAKKQTLFIKPVVKEISSGGDKGDIGAALVALLNGRDFPVNMKNIDPIIAEAGAKTITINSQIADIAARKDIIELKLVPQISAK